MTTNDIDAIRKLTDAATRGPWTTGADKEWSDALVPWALVINANYPLTELEKGPQGVADAEFIAAARTLVPALCDEIEQLRDEVTLTRAALAKVREQLTAELEKLRAELMLFASLLGSAHGERTVLRGRLHDTEAELAKVREQFTAARREVP